MICERLHSRHGDIRVVENVLCVPPGAHPSALPEQRGGGLFNGRDPIPEGLLTRKLKPNGPVKPLLEPYWMEAEQRIDEAFLFGGYLLPHYGHFLLETLTYLWMTQRIPDVRVLFLHCVGDEHLSQWMSDILSVLDFRNEIMLLCRPTTVSTLFLGDPGYRIRFTFRQHHVDFLAARSSPLTDGRRVWLSRQGAPAHSGFANEVELEQLLERSGWIIYRPEAHSVEEQLEMLGRAEHIAGIEGSAFHTLVLLKGLRARLSIIPRRRRINENFETIAAAKQFNQEIFNAPYRTETDPNQPGRVRRFFELPYVASLLESTRV